MTTTVNHPPLVTIQGPATPFYGQDASYTAERSDPDQDGVTVSWSWAPGPCKGDSPSAPSMPATEQPTFTLSAVSLQKGPVCLWAFARDSHGATTAAHLDVIPQDRAPQLTLQVITPVPPAPANDLYPLFTAFTISAEPPAGGLDLDPDGDTVDLTWQLAGPAGAKATLTPCKAPPSSDLRRCFQADLPGRYLVSLTAREAIGDRGAPLVTTASLAVNAAPDALPCLRETDPPIDATTLPLHLAPGGTSKPFWVKSVVDDGDPFPKSQDPDSLQGEPDFRWYLIDPQGNTSVYPTSSAVYLMPTAFRLGETVNVRLEIRDRDLPKMTAAFAACGDAPVCPPQPTSNCLQRVTWTVVFDLPEGT